MNPAPTSSPEPSRGRTILITLSIALGAVSFFIALTYHNIADGDLWARLVAGASVYDTGHVVKSDFLAYTPTLPEWIDHEWGAGLVFYTLLVSLGPMALMLFKVLMAFIALCIPLYWSLTRSRSFSAVLLISLPCALAILPGYVPVVRSHVFTYAFFAITLVALEALRSGKRWPLFTIPAVILVWSNVHGGFVAGLGIIALYTFYSIVARRHQRTMLLVSALSLAVTFVNPYGLRFWSYLLPALLHDRSHITEWGAMPLFGFDPFIGFRILLATALLTMLLGWKRSHGRQNWIQLIILLATAVLGLSHRRHAPFFGVASAMFLPQYLKNTGQRLAQVIPLSLKRTVRPELPAFILAGLVCALTSATLLPGASLQVLAPVGFYPVRECDILSRAKARGRLLVPFRWGSYTAWRLYPDIMVSIDGRYEETFPEEIFLQNHNFMMKTGPEWALILRKYGADFIILEKDTTGLTREDLEPRGFTLIWDGPASCLFATKEKANALLDTALSLPDHTVDPLDRRTANKWAHKITAQ